VEFALAAPLLVGLLVPMADFGIAFSDQIQVQQAAAAGAQYAAFHP
jgi:Flp pilus assembly protein TadG